MQSSVFVGVSLDGYLARENGALDFLDAGHVDPHGYEEFFATVDALVIGRKTYEVVLAFKEWPYGQKPVIVLSTSELAAPPAGAHIERLSGGPAQIWSQLESRGFRHIYVDGGITIQRFLDAGLIRRLVVTRVPVLIGRGIPLFGPVSRDVLVRHIATRTFPSGLVQSEYHLGNDSGEAIAPLW
jgi:dihydrofolate reductase